MIMRDAILWGARSFSVSCTRDTPSDWLAVFSLRETHELSPHQLFFCTNMKFDDICLEICRLAEQNSSMFTAVFFSFAYLYRAVLAAHCLVLSECSDIRYTGAWFVLGYGG